MIKLTDEENMKLLKKEWSKNNEHKMEDCSIAYKYIWECSKGVCKHHIWEASLRNRIFSKSGCPYCPGGGKVCPCKCNSLKVLNPKLVEEEWDYDKNEGLNPEDFLTGSNKKVWWKCNGGVCEHHNWETSIKVRKNAGCPYCPGGGKVCPCKCNSLKALNPKFVEEWDYDKNEELPEDILPNNTEKVWWKCSKGKCGNHNWTAKVSDRNTNCSDCPYCPGGGKVCPCKCNSLKALNPKLVEEWDYDKNEELPDNILSGSTEKVWWKCNKGHSWKAIIYSRTCYKGSNCPICNTSKGETAIRKILLKNNIKFVQEKYINVNTEDYIMKKKYKKYREFYDKINIGKNIKLYLDFFLPETNTVIEFDGIQHFKSISYFGGENRLKKQKLYDIFKSSYCRDNNLRILRIHHNDIEDDIEELIQYLISKNAGFHQLYSTSYPLELLEEHG